MRPCCGGGCCGGERPIRETCNYFYSLVGDPCYQGLCCNDRPKITYKPFSPSYERPRHKMWYSEKNVWHVWKVYGPKVGPGDCCRP